MERDERRVSRRHLFRDWGNNVRQGISELVASSLPGAFEVDEPPAMQDTREAGPPPPPDERTVAELTQALHLDQPPAAED
jgi:hypothetical protein